MIIHCIGDSHVGVFYGKNHLPPKYPSVVTNDIFKLYWVGPYLAYNIGVHDHPGTKTVEDILKGVSHDECVLFSFGEIDCRVHIVGQSWKQQKPIEDVAQDVASRYAEFLLKLMSTGRKVIVFAPVPSSSVKGLDHPLIKECLEVPDRDCLHVGTFIQRNTATKAFIETLKEILPEDSVLSLFKDLINDDMSSKKEYFYDGVHLSQAALPLVVSNLRKMGVI